MEEKARTDGQQTTEQNEQKMSYEELMNAAMQLQQQNQQLQNQLRQTNGIEKRLYFLFEVIKAGDAFGDFKQKCVDEVREIMTLPEEPERKDEPEKKGE